jgi:hypothetical protein
MHAVLTDDLPVDQAQKWLVDQFGRLDAVNRAFDVQAPPGDASQLFVNERHQRLQTRLVSFAQALRRTVTWCVVPTPLHSNRVFRAMSVPVVIFVSGAGGDMPRWTG